MTVRLLLSILANLLLQRDAPPPPGKLVDIGGHQRIHLHCTGRGSPTVVLEAGAGDFSVVWALVQPPVGRFAQVCSYDRAGYAWSDPGARPRTFAQLALELHATLHAGGVPGPYVLVGQSFGASLVRGFAARYPQEVAGMVLIDAVPEDGYVYYDGRLHHLREEATGRVEPPPHIAIDSETIADASAIPPADAEPLEPPLDRLPPAAQRIWEWAVRKPIYRIVVPLEMAWGPEEAQRMYETRKTDPTPLGNRPLIVLARTRGDYASGMTIPADTLEAIRRRQQADLATLSRHGSLRFAPNSGHNIHLADPPFVIRAIADVVKAVRQGDGRP